LFVAKKLFKYDYSFLTVKKTILKGQKNAKNKENQIPELAESSQRSRSGAIIFSDVLFIKTTFLLTFLRQ